MPYFDKKRMCDKITNQYTIQQQRIALTWAGTRSARYIYADPRIAVEIVDASVAIVSGGGVSAIDASSSLGIAAIRVSIALAALAVREVPEAGLALAAGSTVGVGTALAATGLDVAEIIEGTDAVAVARDAALGPESVRSRCAAVATSADHVRLARTHSAIVLA